MEQKITTDIKAPNKDMEILRSHFPHCFDKNGKFDFAKFQQELEAQNVELTFEKESYGLDWLGKSYARLLASDPATTLLKADEIHNQKQENINSQNLLIKGDNLEVLKHLANAYYEKVKMIYIDPPYNTGNDGFIYQDDRKYTVEQLQELLGIDKERAKRILDFTQSKSNSHSAWLTFMYPRLYIAKQLLRDDGVIFVSIDDNEVAQLRLLMDEVFGEENFVDMLIWRKKSGGGQDDIYFAKEHEYLLMYRKTPTFRLIEEIYLDDESNYIYEDEFGKYNLLKLEKWGAGAYKNDAPSLYYSIKTPDGNDYYPVAPDGREGRWRKKPEIVMQENKLEWKKIKNTWKPYEKIYYDPNKEKVKKERTILYNIAENTDGTNELKKLFGIKDIFSNPKPSLLIKHLIKLTTTNDFVILDFFAGSGTTGDAVIQLNAEDGGNRKYILVQIAEPIDPNKNKAAYDFVKDELKAEPTIFEICKERLIRAAKKIKAETIDKKIAEKEKELQNLQGELNLEDRDKKIYTLQKEIEALQKQDLGFKIFETMPIWEDYNFEAEEFNPQQELFDTSKLTEDDLKALLITWKTYDGMPLTEDLETITLDGYPTYYGNGKLYLMHKGFTTDTLKTLLEKIDSDKHFEPKTIIAFGYHFGNVFFRRPAVGR